MKYLSKLSLRILFSLTSTIATTVISSPMAEDQEPLQQTNWKEKITHWEGVVSRQYSKLSKNWTAKNRIQNTLDYLDYLDNKVQKRQNELKQHADAFQVSSLRIEKQAQKQKKIVQEFTAYYQVILDYYEKNNLPPSTQVSEEIYKIEYSILEAVMQTVENNKSAEQMSAKRDELVKKIARLENLQEQIVLWINQITTNKQLDKLEEKWSDIELALSETQLISKQTYLLRTENQLINDWEKQKNWEDK